MTDAPSDLQAESPSDKSDGTGVVLPSNLHGLVLWLDPAQGITTFPTFTWRDRSDEHNDAVAPVGADPVIDGPWSGLPPAVRFSGMNQYLSLPSGMSDFTLGLSLFVVAEPHAHVLVEDNVATRFIDFAAAARSHHDAVTFGRHEADTSALLYQVFVGDRVRAPEPVHDVVGNYSRQLFAVIAAGGNPGADTIARYFKNGVTLPARMAQVPLVVDRASNLIGRSNVRATSDGGLDREVDYGGFLAEIILYNRALSDDERRAVEAYLHARWRLP